MPHAEVHRSQRSNWLRASLLGANDGLISTSSLVIGIASAGAARGELFLAATAGMVAGALSMAAGEYVSVSSQSDAEAADLQLERSELEARPEAERAELERIYRSRGLGPELARAVADGLMSHDALDSHARDELGIHERMRARPIQAALASAGAFTAGALAPVVFAGVLPVGAVPWVVVISTLVLLPLLGATAARLGGASVVRPALRVVFWGAVAMAGTALIGRLFGARV